MCVYRLPDKTGEGVKGGEVMGRGWRKEEGMRGRKGSVGKGKEAVV